MTKRDLARESRATWKLAWPIIGAQLSQMSMSFVDTLMVGRLGAQSLAALAMANALYVFAMVFFMGILAALSPMVSQAFGAKKDDEIGRVTHDGIALALILALLGVILFSQAGTLLRWMGQPQDLIPTGHLFLSRLSLGFPAIMTYYALRQLTEGTSKARPSLIIAIIGSCANLVGNYLFVFGHFGFPALGVIGSATSTVVVQWTMLGAMLLYIWLSPRYRPFVFRDWNHRIQWNRIGHLLRLGVPLGGVYFAETGFFATCALLMGRIGMRELAAHQVAINAAAFFFMIPLGLSIAVGIRVGQAYGAGSVPGVRKAGYAGFFMTIAIQSVAALIFLFGRYGIVALYTSDQSLTHLAAELLFIAGVFQLVDGLQIVGVGTLRGLKDTRVPFLASLAAYWLIGLTFGASMAFLMGWGPHGLWWGMVLGLSVASASHWIRFRLLMQRLTVSGLSGPLRPGPKDSVASSVVDLSQAPDPLQ